MAAYDYRCRVCDTRFEVRRAVTDREGTLSCPAGHDAVSRVFTAVAVGARGAAGPAPAGRSAASSAGGGCCGGGCCG